MKQLEYERSQSRQHEKQMPLEEQEQEVTSNLSWQKKKKRADEKFKAKVNAALDEVVNEHATGFTKPHIASCLVLVLWTYASAICQSFMILLVKKWLRENVFTPWAILREMDLAGGTLSYEGLELLRCIEMSGKKHVCNCVIPSSAQLKQTAKKVEKFASELCPFNVVPCELGEMIQFAFIKTVGMILKAFGLHDIAKVDSVTLAESIDGADLLKHLGHTTASFKPINRRGRCPLTSRLLLNNIQS